MSWLGQPGPQLSWLQLNFPRDLDQVQVRQLLTSLLSSANLPVVLEVYGQSGKVGYRIGTCSSGHLSGLVEAFLPGAAVSASTREVGPDGRAWSLSVNTKHRPMKPDDSLRWSRQLHALLADPSNDGFVHQIVIDKWLSPRYVPNGLRNLPAESWAQAFGRVLAGPADRPLDAESRKALADKQSSVGAVTTVRLLQPGVDHSQSRKRSLGYLALLRSLESPGLRIGLHRDDWRLARSGRRGSRPVPLNLNELATITGWPQGASDYPGLDRAGSQILSAASATKTGRIIGRSLHPASSDQDVALSTQDGLRHLHVLGPSGVGKSTLLLNLALQDISAGRGCVVLDPKGDLVDDVLARVPSQHHGRLVVLDQARSDHIAGLNPLQAGAAQRELAVDGIVHVFRSLNVDSWGPRTQDILHSSLLTLVGSKHATLCAVPRLLTDPTFRRNVRSSGHSNGRGPLQAFWSWYEDLSDNERAAVIAPVMNKLRPFLLRSSLRGMLGQVEPKFDLRQVFTQKKVVLVPLRKGLIGAESANLLGSLLVSRLWQLAQERSALPQERRHPVFVYADEFQDYLRLPMSFEDVLAQARGLGVGMVLAHQHLGQLGPSVRAAVLANAQSRVHFRLSAEDAKAIAQATPELETVDYTALPAYQAYASMLASGQATPPASIQTLPAGQPLRRPQDLADDLARRWGTPATEVDELLYGSAASDDLLDKPIGRRRKQP